MNNQLRIKEIQNKLTEEGLDALILTDPKNIYYVSGFIGLAPHERESIVLITKDQTYLYLTGMYRDRAAGLAQQHLQVIPDNNHQGVFSLLLKDSKTFTSIGVESRNITHSEYSYLEKSLRGSLRGTTELVKNIRSQKDAAEVEVLRTAAHLTDHTMREITTFLQKNDYTKYTERDIARIIRNISEEKGGHGFGFDPIVAYGKHSAEPHYAPGDTSLKPGGALLIDIGILYEQYSGDLTRTLYLGTAPEQFRHDYNLVNTVREKAINSVSPNISGEQLHTNAVELFREHDVADLFIHSLGHGVGLHIHELPHISFRNTEHLVENMVITIEPGIYRTDEYGIRIEDLLLVTSTGYELLSESPRDLVEIKQS